MWICGHVRLQSASSSLIFILLSFRSKSIYYEATELRFSFKADLWNFNLWK